MSEAKIMDAIDRRILRIVQKDASLPIAEIASQVGLSQTPCWKRLQRLTVSGVIKRRVALLDPARLGLGTTVFVTIQAGEHSAKALARFAADVAGMEEVIDFYRVAGDVDYVLRVAVEDAAAFDALLQAVDRTDPAQKCNVAFCPGKYQVRNRFAGQGRKRACTGMKARPPMVAAAALDLPPFGLGRAAARASRRRPPDLQLFRALPLLRRTGSGPGVCDFAPPRHYNPCLPAQVSASSSAGARLNVPISVMIGQSNEWSGSCGGQDLEGPS